MSIKISVFSLFRDSESYLDRFFSDVKSVEKATNAEFEYFFYENDSTDNTADILKKWIKNKKGKVLSENVNEKSYGSTLEPNRMIKMARIRNKMAELGKPVSSDYCIVIDSDITFDKNIINDYLKFKNLNFSMLTPNVRQTVPCKMECKSSTSYYDSLSLIDSNWNQCMTWSDNPFYSSDDRLKFKQNKPIEVRRSFGGFVFIKSELFNKVKWHSEGDLEHWYFCDQLRKLAPIYFIPSIKPLVKTDQTQFEHEEMVIDQQKIFLESWKNSNSSLLSQNMNFKISYAITACNESEELKKLISFLQSHKREKDEIVIQLDQDNHTDDTIDTINSYGLNYITFPLNNDFSAFKNNLNKACTGDYIFQLDADEIPSLETVQNLHFILSANPDSELFLVPRINKVEGLTEEHLKKWNWQIDSNNRINWPDYQYRIYKNRFYIKWVNKVHEIIDGAQIGIQLPADEKFAITHNKSLEKQEKQNSFYQTI